MSDPLHPELDRTRRDLEAALTELQHLCIDLSELQVLHQEQSQQLDLHKTEPPKDFSGRADLEAKRSALNTMLSEQQGHVQSAQARVDQLEAQMVRSERVERAVRISCDVQDTRSAIDEDVRALVSTVRPQLQRIIERCLHWSQQRRAWFAVCAELGARDTCLDTALSYEALLSELWGAGAAVDAVHLQRTGEALSLLDRLDPWPYPLRSKGNTPPLELLEITVQQMVVQALQRVLQLEGRGVPVGQL